MKELSNIQLIGAAVCGTICYFFCRTIISIHNKSMANLANLANLDKKEREILTEIEERKEIIVKIESSKKELQTEIEELQTEIEENHTKIQEACVRQVQELEAISCAYTRPYHRNN